MRITYIDKTNITPVVNRGSQSTADDFNEIKSVVNSHELDIARKISIYTGKNKFNSSDTTIIPYKYLNSLGIEATGASYGITAYIPISSGDIFVKNDTSFGGTVYTALYDEDLALISTVNTKSFSYVAGAKYFRTSFLLASIATFQIELGDTSTSFEKYTELNQKIGATELLDGSVSSAKLSSLSVGTSKIVANSVTEDKIAGLSISTDKIKEAAITEGKTIFFDKSKNLFNPEDTDIVYGYYVNYLNGNLFINAIYNTTGFIPVTAGLNYAISYSNQVAFYDSNKIYISGFYNTGVNVMTAPAGTAFVRCTVLASGWGTFQIEQANAPTSWVAYSNVLSEKYAPLIPTEKIINEAVTEPKTIFFEPSKNLFNVEDSDVSLGYYVNTSYGGLIANASYNSTGFIPVTAGQAYTLSYKHNIVWFNSAKAFISSSTSVDTNKTQTAPAGAVYLRCTVSLAAWAAFQVELGSSETSYQAYGFQLKSKYIPETTDTFVNEITSPAKQYVLGGYENSIYYQAMAKRWLPNHNFVRIEGGQWVNGKNKARILNPTAETTGVAAKIYDLDFQLVATKSFNVQIGLQATDNGLVNGIFIGDSLSYNGYYIVKVNSLLPNLDWDGLRNSYSSPTLFGEGRGGWKVSNYFENLTGSLTDSFTPFMQPVDPYRYFGGTNFWKTVKSGSTDYGINGFAAKASEIGFSAATGLLTSPAVNDCMWVDANSRYERWNGSAWVVISSGTLNFSFNFAKYRSTWGITQPDIVTIMLGTNDFRSQTSEASIDAIWETWKSRVETMVAGIKADNSSAKIGLLIPPSVCGSLDNSGGDFTIRQNAMMWYARKKIITDFDAREAESIYLVDVGRSIDPRYGFEEVADLPFSDYTGTNRRTVLSNVPHPSTAGYYQMAIPLAGWIQKIR